jgi:hypothetical protein
VRKDTAQVLANRAFGKSSPYLISPTRHQFYFPSRALPPSKFHRSTNAGGAFSCSHFVAWISSDMLHDCHALISFHFLAPHPVEMYVSGGIAGTIQHFALIPPPTSNSAPSSPHLITHSGSTAARAQTLRRPAACRDRTATTWTTLI